MDYHAYRDKQTEAINLATKLIDVLQTLDHFTDSKAMLAHDEYTNLLNNYKRSDDSHEDIEMWKHTRDVMRYENEKYTDTLRLLKRVTGADYSNLN